MKNLRECYESLPTKEQATIREAFMQHFECSFNTFYRTLDEANPRLKHLSWFYENAGFCFDFKKSVFILETPKRKQRLAAQLGLIAA